MEDEKLARKTGGEEKRCMAKVMNGGGGNYWPRRGAANQEREAGMHGEEAESVHGT